MNHPPVYPLLCSEDVARLLDWANPSLGLEEVWRDPRDGSAVEHAELGFSGGRISINQKTGLYTAMDPSGIALNVASRESVDKIAVRATAAGATIAHGPEESFVSYSLTAIDPDGNQWWVHAETGALDALRGQA